MGFQKRSNKIQKLTNYFFFYMSIIVCMIVIFYRYLVSFLHSDWKLSIREARQCIFVHAVHTTVTEVCEIHISITCFLDQFYNRVTRFHDAIRQPSSIYENKRIDDFFFPVIQHFIDYYYFSIWDFRINDIISLKSFSALLKSLYVLKRRYLSDRLPLILGI